MNDSDVIDDAEENADDIDAIGNDDEIPGLLQNGKRVRFADAIDTIAKSRDRFSKRDQLAADRVRRLHHVSGFPSDDALVYSVLTNGIKNNLISKRDMIICKDMLGKSRHVAQGKTTMKSSTPLDANTQRVELPPIILTCYGNVQVAADAL